MKNSINQLLFQNPIWESILKKEIPVNEWLRTKTLGLGLINVSLFGILTITGILLMFYYTPHAEKAYQDIKDLQFASSFGLIIRNMHYWAANLMIISVFLHMARVFYTGEYQKPREFNWVVGVFLFILTLGAALTGYFLPWDQKAYWGMTIMSNVMASIPLIGEKLKYIVLGGTEVGQSALLRFYVIHVKVLPLVIGLLISIHVWRIRRDDRLNESQMDPETVVTANGNNFQENNASIETESGWIDILARELSKIFLILAIVMAMSVLFNAPLEEVATPAITPNPTKASWFLLGLQEILSWGAPFFGAVVIPNLVLLCIVLIPYIDRRPTASGIWFHPSRRIQNILFTAFAVVVIGLIIVGKFMRGPNWVLYWPWESWPIH